MIGKLGMLVSCFCTGWASRTSITNTHSAFDVVVLGLLLIGVELKSPPVRTSAYDLGANGAGLSEQTVE